MSRLRHTCALLPVLLAAGGGCTVLGGQTFTEIDPSPSTSSAGGAATSSSGGGATGGAGGTATTSSSAGGDGGGGAGSGGSGGGGSGGSGGGSGGSGGGSGGSGGGSGGSAGEGSGGGSSCTLSDEFDDPTTIGDCWTWIDAIFATSQVTGGQLTIEPVGGAAPWNEELGPFLYKEITGNFSVVTYVVAGSVGDNSVPPAEDYNMAGLFVRAPVDPAAFNQEDWIKWEIGRRDMNVAPTPGLLAARTIDSTSQHVLPYSPIDAHAGGLGMCRIGNSFGLYWRVAPGDYVNVYQLSPPMQIAQMPQTVQVGLIAGAFYIGQADIVAEFSHVRFGAAPNSGAECEQILEGLDP